MIRFLLRVLGTLIAWVLIALAWTIGRELK
jgi:hypothetical protein